MDKLRGKYFSLIVGIVINLALFIVKLYIGLSSNSISIMTDAINNCTDTIVGIIAFIGFLFILEKANNKYPFGLGRVEYIVSFIMSLMLMVVGFLFVYASLERLFYARPIWFTWRYFYVLLVTAIVKLIMAIYYKWVYQLQKSQVFRIMSVDNFVDSIITSMVLLSFVLMNFVKVNIDAVIGLVISVLVVANGIKFIIDSTSRLLGKNIDGSLRQLVTDTVSNFDGVKYVSEIMVHDYGTKNKIAIIEVVFDDGLSVNEIIDKSESIKVEIYKNFNMNTKIVLKGENYGKNS